MDKGKAMVAAGRSIARRTRISGLRWAASLVLVAALATGLLLALVDPFTTLFFVSYALVAAVLVIRRPRNAVSWILLAISFGLVGTTERPDLDVDALVAGSAAWGDFLFAWMAGWWGQVSFFGFLVLSLVFPDGHLPRGRSRVVAIGLAGIAASSALLAALGPSLSVNIGGATSVSVPNRFAILPDLPLWSIATPDVTILLTVGAMVVGAAWLVVRYRRATGIQRLQLRWLTAAIGFSTFAIAFGLVVLAVVGERAWFAWIPAIAAYPTIPVAIGIAVMRYRLFEIDRIISRTLSYAIVTAILGALFVGLVIGLQAVALPIVGGSEIAVAVSTLAVAALFGPLRRRVQDLVNRRFDRARYDTAQVAAGFGARLRNRLDLDDVSAELVSTAQLALRPASASVWVRSEDRTS